MSPIIGLTDRAPSFKELGRLRLGIPKSEAAVSGPREIHYFRADFRPDAGDALATFIQVYGNQPTSINFRLPFAEVERCWDAWYEVYNKFGMLGKADGRRWVYLRHNRTGELLAKDGVPLTMEGTKVTEEGEVYLPFDKSIPVYSYKSKKGEDVQVFAHPVGRLRIVIPELKRAAYVQIITNSLYNCIKLSEQLAGVVEVARNVGMTLPQVPLVITRRKESISVTFSGHKQMQEHYLLNVEIDPRWMEAQFQYLNAMLPGGAAVALAIPMLAQGGPATESAPTTERTFIPEELQEGAEGDPEPENHVAESTPAEPKASAGLTNGTPRPYKPEVLKAKLADVAKNNYFGKTATQKQRNLVAQLLGEIFAGPDSDLQRHALQVYLFEKPSLLDVDGSLILTALNVWLAVKKDTGGAYVSDPIAIKEALLAYDEAVRIQGQMALPLGEAEKVAENIPF